MRWGGTEQDSHSLIKTQLLFHLSDIQFIIAVRLSILVLFALPVCIKHYISICIFIGWPRRNMVFSSELLGICVNCVQAYNMHFAVAQQAAEGIKANSKYKRNTIHIANK